MLLSVSLFLLSCDRQPNKITLRTQQPPKDAIKFVQSSLELPLDSITGPRLQCLQYYADKTDSLLIYLNEETGVIYSNDIKSRKIIKRIELMDGKSDHRKHFQGFYYHNPDSIFLFYFGPAVALMNSQGKLIRNYKLNSSGTRSDQKQNLAYKGFYSTTSNQGFLHGDTLFLNSIVLGGNKIPRKDIQILLNVHDGSSRLREMEFPSQYRKNKFGGGDFDIYSMSFNPLAKRIIYSFPADENLISRDLHSESSKRFFANGSLADHINEYDKKTFDNGITDPQIEHYMTSPSFGQVLFDRYKNVYYRILLLPVAKHDANYGEKNAPLKQIVVMVFDRTFKMLGECKLPADKYMMSSSFVSSNGLNIQHKPLTDEKLVFTVLRFHDLVP